MMPSRPIRIVVILMALICTAVCDHVTKHFARTELERIGPIILPGHFIELILAENPGAFLSLGASFPPAVRSVLTACVSIGLAFLLVYLVSTPRLQWVFFLGLALVWSGGVSNLIDRIIRHGLVTDFVMLRFGPLHTGIFNLADLAITVGMLLALIAPLHARPPKNEIR